MNRAFVLLLSSVLALTLAACGGDGDAPVTWTPAAATHTPSPVPEATATPEVATAPLPWELPRTATTPGVLMADWGPRAGWSSGGPGATSAALLPLHPETAEDLTGYQPIDFGHFFSTAVSPDGRLLAAVVGPTQESTSTFLTLIDLDSWKPLPAAVGLPRGLEIIGWTEDGTALFVKLEDQLAGEITLFRVSRSGDVTQIGATRGLRTRSWGPTLIAPDGGTLYLPGYDGEQCCGIEVEGGPYILQINAATGRETARVELPELRFGQRFEAVAGHTGEYNVSLHPALALSPDGAGIYIAHADEDRLTVVDTATMTVRESVEVEAPRSAFSRLGSWLRDQLVSVAEAKGGLSSFRSAMFSADGRSLLLTGERYEPCEGVEYSECTIEPMGLLVVDVETLEAVARIEDVDSVTVTPDGRYWLGAGDFWDWRTSSGNAEVTGYGLQVIDAHTFAVVETVRPGTNYLDLAVSPGGRYAYLVSEGKGYVEDPHTHVRRCEKDCWRITTVDLSALGVTSERSLSSTYLQLVGLTP